MISPHIITPETQGSSHYFYEHEATEQARAMAMQAKAPMADAPVAVEAGKSTVNITVSGTVQLR